MRTREDEHARDYGPQEVLRKNAAHSASEDDARDQPTRRFA
jgi:hypothetical protein